MKKYWNVNRLLILLIFTGFLSTKAQQFTPIDAGDLTTDSTNTNGASFVDIDNDGDLDVFLSNAQSPYGQNTLYVNLGNDQFRRVDAGELTGLQTPTFGNTWGDYDNDGKPDVFIVNAFTSIGSLMYRNMGENKFIRNENYNQFQSDVRGFNADFGDFDNDGLVDLVVSHPAKFVGMPITGNYLFKNEGNGVFSEIKNTPVVAFSAPFTNASWIDHDMDGDADLFIGSGPANGTLAPDKIFRNMLKESGTAYFQPIRNEVFATDSLDGQVWNWIDYDNDGDLDGFVTNWGGVQGGLSNNFYENKGDTIVRSDKGPLTSDAFISLANVWADFDNDGDIDCYVGNGSNQPNNYYQNNGDGTFTAIRKGHLVETNKNTWGVCAGDYDNDGDIDLLVTNKTQYISGTGDVNFLYRNDLKNNNNWINITLSGVESNKMGIGAKVFITSENDETGAVNQYREAGASNTFLGDNDIRIHFGLGNGAVIKKITIQWPSGQRDVYEDIEVNNFYHAIEGGTFEGK